MLKGKTALITGGAQRIGGAITAALAQAGVNVAVHYRNSGTAAAERVMEARERGVRAVALQADLSSEEETGKLFDEALELTGRIDILVNSASIFPAQRLQDFSWGELTENLQVNSWAPLLLCRRFAAQGCFARVNDPKPAEELGNIVNLLDTRIVDRDPAHAAYHLSKRMLFSMTRMLSLELAPSIKVNGIAPGLILPPPGEGPEYLERMRGTNPLQRFGSTEEIAAALIFLLQMSFVTGEVIFIDGGRRLQGSMYGT